MKHIATDCSYNLDDVEMVGQKGKQWMGKSCQQFLETVMVTGAFFHCMKKICSGEPRLVVDARMR